MRRRHAPAAGARKIDPDWVGEALRYAIQEDSPQHVVAGRMKVYSRLRMFLEHPRYGSMHLYVSDSREQLGSAYSRNKDHLGRIMGIWDEAYEDEHKTRGLIKKEGTTLPDVARYPEVYVLICCDLIAMAPSALYTTM